MHNDSMTSSFGNATTNATTMAPIRNHYHYLLVVIVFVVVSRIITTIVSIIIKYDNDVNNENENNITKIQYNNKTINYIIINLF